MLLLVFFLSAAISTAWRLRAVDSQPGVPAAITASGGRSPSDAWPQVAGVGGGPISPSALPSPAAITDRGPDFVYSPTFVQPVRPEDATSDAPPSQAILDKAVADADSHRFVSASIRQRADLMGRQLLGSGRYLELRQGVVPMIRLELSIEIAGQMTSLVQVCDGRLFWTYRKMLDGESLSHVDAVRATAALDGLLTASTTPAAAADVPGLGGISRLIRGLRASFRFATAERGQLGELPVWRLEGDWKADQLAKVLPKQRDAILAGKPADLSRLPIYMPDRVVLLLGQEDLFPYRIEFRRIVPPKKSSSTEPRSVATLEFFEVNFSAPINPAQFIYTPGALAKADQDRTDEFLQSIGAVK